MPIVTLRRFGAPTSVYSLLDADTEDARAFTTYLNYWTGLADGIQQYYGMDVHTGLLQDLRSRKDFRRLTGRGRPADLSCVGELLRNAWMSQFGLHLIDLDDATRLSVDNHDAPVKAYYATTRVATAWLAVQNAAAPTTHRSLLNAVSTMVTGTRLLPPPWNMTCSAIKPSPTYSGFQQAPGTSSNLSPLAPAEDRIAMLLRTTRRKALEKRVADIKHHRKLTKAPKGEAERQDAQLLATTVFDFAWRNRTRSHYGDPSMHFAGALDQYRDRAFASNIRTWTDTTMLLFEALIAQRAKAELREHAVFVIGRDRSGMAETLLLPRMKALGVL